MANINSATSFNLPLELRKRFKIAAAERGTDQSTVVRTCIEAWLENPAAASPLANRECNPIELKVSTKEDLRKAQSGHRIASIEVEVHLGRLRTILESGNPVAVPAILRNLDAFDLLVALVRRDSEIANESDFRAAYRAFKKHASQYQTDGEDPPEEPPAVRSSRGPHGKGPSKLGGKVKGGGRS